MRGSIFMRLSVLITLCVAQNIAANDTLVAYETSELFQCKDGSGEIPWVKYCDKNRDCGDGSDEEKCVDGVVERRKIFEWSRELSELTFFTSGDTTIDDEDFGIKTAQDGSVLGLKADGNKKISFLPIGVSEKFPNLNEYIFKWCAIGKVSKAHFKGFKKLVRIDLFLNEIRSVEAGSFDELISLKRLDLSQNYLKSIDGNLLKNLKNLDEVNFSANQISTFDENLLENLHELTEISISTNKFKTLPPLLFKNNKKLFRIFLNNNQIEEIPEGFFASLTRLDMLWMQDNKISVIPPLAFKDLENLRSFDLSDNNMKVLSKDIFEFNKNVEKIEFKKNKIEKIDAEIFVALEKLVFVDLSGNTCINKKYGGKYDYSKSFDDADLKNDFTLKCQ